MYQTPLRRRVQRTRQRDRGKPTYWPPMGWTVTALTGGLTALEAIGTNFFVT